MVLIIPQLERIVKYIKSVRVLSKRAEFHPKAKALGFHSVNSRKVSCIVAQLTKIISPNLLLFLCSARATMPLPVPVSPEIRIFTDVAASGRRNATKNRSISTGRSENRTGRKNSATIYADTVLCKILIKACKRDGRALLTHGYEVGKNRFSDVNIRVDTSPKLPLRSGYLETIRRSSVIPRPATHQDKRHPPSTQCQ